MAVVLRRSVALRGTGGVPSTIRNPPTDWPPRGGTMFRAPRARLRIPRPRPFDGAALPYGTAALR